MAVNKGINHIHISFDLKKLIAKLESDDTFLWDIAGDKIKPDIYKGIAKGARGKILKGNLRRLKDSTVRVRKEAGQMPPIPLFRTGKLQKSIKAEKDGVYVEDYGIDHLEGYTIKAGSDDFTENWKRDVFVKPRNFLPDAATIPIRKRYAKHIYQAINRLIRKKGR
tara:strand:+ start:344 stop:841 length:498 start_codon:yes stop_codon:yes gene_type:complete